MKLSIRFFTILTFTFLSIPGFSQEELPVTVDYSPTIKNLTAYIADQVKNNKVKGLSLALVDDQKIVWTEGFGVTDEKLKTPATGETLYRAGALSQIFTALEIMKLAERKRIRLDDPVQKAIPDFDINDR